LTKTASPEVNSTELKLYAMLANHASTVRSLTEQPTHVSHQDQLAHVKVTLTSKPINARDAQLTNSETSVEAVSAQTILVSTDMPIQQVSKPMLDKPNCKEELWLSQLTKTASPEVNTLEVKIHATLVNHASMDKFFKELPTHVTLDHLLHVDVSKRDLQMDTLVYNAHSTKLLIQATQVHAWLNYNALVFKLDSQETTKTVEDAKTAISQLRFQTMNKLDVSLDQSQLAHAFKEAPIKDTPVLIASQDKLLMSLTQTETPVSHQLHAWVHNKSPLELTELVAVDAKLANSQDNNQILPEPDVSIDHSPFVVAQRDNQLMDIHAKHAQPVKLLNKTTKSNAILQPAQEITK
jgi:hypothetical protein